MTEVKAVEVRAQLLRIRTRADRTTDLTLNIPEDCSEQVKALFGWLMDEVEMVVVQSEKTWTDLDDEARKEPERRTSKVGRRRS